MLWGGTSARMVTVGVRQRYVTGGRACLPPRGGLRRQVGRHPGCRPHWCALYDGYLRALEIGISICGSCLDSLLQGEASLATACPSF